MWKFIIFIYSFFSLTIVSRCSSLPVAHVGTSGKVKLTATRCIHWRTLKCLSCSPHVPKGLKNTAKEKNQLVLEICHCDKLWARAEFISSSHRENALI